MSSTISCPSCQRTLRVPESLLGKNVKCPGCSHRFTAADQSESEEEAPRRSTSVSEKPSRRPAAPPSPPPEDEEEERRPSRRAKHDDDEDDDRRIQRSGRDEDEDDDEERGPSPRDVKAGWDKVRMGINLVMIGLWVWIGSSVLAALGGLLGIVLLGGTLASNLNNPNFASLGFAGVLVILSVGVYYLGTFAEFVLRLIGYGLCMAVPAQRRGGLKPLALTAFILSAVTIAFSLLNIAISGFSGFNSFNSLNKNGHMDVAGSGIGLLGGLCALASFVVYLFFLRSVCTAVRARELSSKPISVLIAFVCFWVISIVLMIIIGCAGAATLGSALQSQSSNKAVTSLGIWMVLLIAFGCIAVLAFMGLYVWYILILQKIRDAVASYRRRL